MNSGILSDHSKEADRVKASTIWLSVLFPQRPWFINAQQTQTKTSSNIFFSPLLGSCPNQIRRAISVWWNFVAFKTLYGEACLPHSYQLLSTQPQGQHGTLQCLCNAKEVFYLQVFYLCDAWAQIQLLIIIYVCNTVGKTSPTRSSQQFYAEQPIAMLTGTVE